MKFVAKTFVANYEPLLKLWIRGKGVGKGKLLFIKFCEKGKANEKEMSGKKTRK